MKTNHFKLNSTLFLIALFFVAFTVSSCSKKVQFLTSEVVPAAAGKVKISTGDNDNYKIDIEILHLAEPDKLNPPKKYYVIWMETANNGVVNLGQINSSTGFFSNTLKAEIHTITPYKPVKVFITAEDSASIGEPGTRIVLTTKSF